MNPENKSHEGVQGDDPGVRGDPAEAYAHNTAWFAADVPEYYADTININTSAYGMSLTFGTRGLAGPRPKARIFMSHEMALVASRLLYRVLRTYERDNDVVIPVPESILAQLRIRPEDLLELGQTAVDGDEGEDLDGV